jgi:uncharacterized protein YjdB
MRTKLNLTVSILIAGLIIFTACKDDLDDKVPTDFKGIEISNNKLVMIIGDTDTISATYFPTTSSTTLIWSSSAPDVVSID